MGDDRERDMTDRAIVRSAITALFLTTGLAGLPSGARADDAAAAGAASAPSAEPVATLDPNDIIVTARKRNESILNVPVIETAITAATLERLQTQDLQGITKLVPGLSLGSSVLAVGTQVSIRGVGNSTLDAGVDQSVSLNLDGLQLSQGLAYSSGLFDVGTVEVLKGPQTLFYGKSSPGGVISLRTADPTDKFEVTLRGGREFEAREWRGEATISGPVTDTLGLRVAAMYDHTGGFYRNIATPLAPTGAAGPAHHRAGDSTSYIIRGTAVFKPAPNFDARLKVNAVHDKIIEPVLQLISCPDGIVPPGTIPFVGGPENCHKDRNLTAVDMNPAAFPNIKNDGIPFITTNQLFGSFEMNYRPQPEITLTSTTGYYHAKSKSALNATQSGYAAPPFVAENDFKRHDFTQELRANSDFHGPVNFTVGAFYQDGQVSNLVTTVGNIRYSLPALLAAIEHNLSIKAYSFFGQGRWQVLPNVELAGGARWSHEKRGDTPYNTVTGTPVLIPTAQPTRTSHNLSPEFTLTWKPDMDLTVFGSYKRGYKSGSYSITSVVAPGADNSFGDEKVKGGEIGLKARLLDRRMLINIAAYDYHFTGLQVGSTEANAGGLPVTHTLNAGAAKVYGLDFDAAYRPPEIEGLNLHASAEWNHARFKQLDNVPCFGGQMVSEGCNQVLNPATNLFTAQSLDGAPLVRAPDWQVNFGFDYEMPMGSNMKLGFSSNNQYSSQFLTNLGDRQDFYQKKFLKADVVMTLTGPGDRWEVSALGKNLNNALTANNCLPSNTANGIILGGEVTGGTTRGPAGIDEVSCFMDRGREVWLRATLRFGG
jgi:iron complex outermembrane receptor protein